MDQEKRAQMLGTEPIKKVLLKLSIPAILGMMVSAIYNFVDALFVAQLGTEAMGAITVTMPLFMLISAFGLMFGTGAASYISRLLGQKNIDKANQTAIVALITSALCALVFTFVGLFALGPLLNMFGATATILPYAKSYAGVLIFGSIFTMCNMTMNNMLRAEGSAKMSMIGIMSGAILNIILDPIFIFYFDMGIKGAAVATVISQAVSTVILLRCYLAKKSYLRLSLKHFKPSVEIYSEIFKIGIPTLLRQGLSSVGMAMINTAAAVFGDPAVAAMGIVGRITMMSFYVLFGFSQGFQPLAGFNYGAKNYTRAREAINVSIKWTTIYSILVAGLFAVGAPFLIAAFTADSTVLEIGIKGLRYNSFIFPTLGFTIIYNSVFMSFGRAKAAALLSMARQGIFLIPLVMILPRLFDLNGVLLSQPIANALSFGLTVIMAMSITRELKELEKTESKKELVAD